jgi:pimeloyl-ACP methyl ester carboxylesterase
MGLLEKTCTHDICEAVYAFLYLLTEKEQKETYDKNVYESGRAIFEMAFWLFDSMAASRVDESKVTCPVLVVAGALDRAIPPSVAYRVARKYKAVSTYRVFENHGHMVVTEPRWQEVAEYIGGWLRPPRTAF